MAAQVSAVHTWPTLVLEVIFATSV